MINIFPKKIKLSLLVVIYASLLTTSKSIASSQPIDKATKLQSDYNNKGSNYLFNSSNGVDLNGYNAIFDIDSIKYVDSDSYIENTRFGRYSNVANVTFIPSENYAFLGSFKREQITKVGTINVIIATDKEFGLSGRSIIGGDLNLENGHTIIAHPDSFATFGAKNINVKGNSRLSAGLSIIRANINLSSGTSAKIGFINKIDDNNIVCGQFESKIGCEILKISDEDFQYTSVLDGNVNLKENSDLTLGKTLFDGSIQAEENSNVHLTDYSVWYITDDSDVDIIENNGVISFYNHSHILNIKNRLTGKGIINISVNNEDGLSKNLVLHSSGNEINLGINNINELQDIDKIKLIDLKVRGSNNISLLEDSSYIKGFKYKLISEANAVYMHKSINSGCYGKECFSEIINNIATINDASINTIIDSNNAVLNYFASMSLMKSNNSYSSIDISSYTYLGNYYLINNQFNNHLNIGADSNRFFDKNYFFGGALSISHGSVSVNKKPNYVVKGLAYLRLKVLDNLLFNIGLGKYYAFLKPDYNKYTLRGGFNIVSSIVGKFNINDNLYIIPDTSFEYYLLTSSKFKDISLDNSSIMRFKLGIKLNYKLSMINGIKYNAYFDNRITSLLGLTNTQISNTSYDFKHEKNQLSTSVGFNIGFNDHVSSDFNIGYLFIKNYESSFNLSARLKISW